MSKGTPEDRPGEPPQTGGMPRRDFIGGTAAFTAAVTTALGTGNLGRLAEILAPNTPEAVIPDLGAINGLFSDPDAARNVLGYGLEAIHAESKGLAPSQIVQLAAAPFFFLNWLGVTDKYPQAMNLALLGGVYGAEGMLGNLENDAILAAQIYSLAFVFGEKLDIQPALVRKKITDNQGRQRDVFAQPSMEALHDAQVLAQLFLGTLLTNTGVARASAALLNGETSAVTKRLRDLGHPEEDITRIINSMTERTVANLASANPPAQPAFPLEGTHAMGITGDPIWKNPFVAVLKPILDVRDKAEVYAASRDAGLPAMTLITQIVVPMFQGLLPGNPAIGQLVERVKAVPEAAQLFMNMLQTIRYEPFRQISESVQRGAYGEIFGPRIQAIIEAGGAIMQDNAQEVAAHILPSKMGDIAEALNHANGIDLSESEARGFMGIMLDEARTIFNEHKNLGEEAIVGIRTLIEARFNRQIAQGDHITRQTLFDDLFDVTMQYVNGVGRYDENGNPIYDKDALNVSQTILLKIRNAYKIGLVMERLEKNSTVWEHIRPDDKALNDIAVVLDKIGALDEFTDPKWEENFMSNLRSVLHNNMRIPNGLDQEGPGKTRGMESLVIAELRNLGYFTVKNTPSRLLTTPDQFDHLVTQILDKVGPQLRRLHLVGQFYSGVFAEDIDPQELRRIAGHFVNGHLETFGIDLALNMSRIAVAKLGFNKKVGRGKLLDAFRKYGSVPNYLHKGWSVVLEKVIPQVVLAKDIGQLYVTMLEGFANGNWTPEETLEAAYWLTHLGGAAINTVVKNPGTLGFVESSYIAVFKKLFPGITDEAVRHLPLYRLMLAGTEIDAEQFATLNSNPTPLHIFAEFISTLMPSVGEVFKANWPGILAALANAEYQFAKEDGVANSGGLLTSLYNNGIAHGDEALLALMVNDGGTLADPMAILARVDNNPAYKNNFIVGVLRSVRKHILAQMQNNHKQTSPQWINAYSTKLLLANNNDANQAIAAIDVVIKSLTPAVRR